MFKSLKANEIFIIICVWFSASVSLLSDSINAVALYGVLPTAFLVTALFKWSSGSSKYLSILTVLYIWILFSGLWATDIQHATRQFKQILGAFIFCVIVVKNCQNQKCIPYFYVAFIILLIGDWCYAHNNIFDAIDVGDDRVNDDKLNANTFAYHTFYVTQALFFLGEIAKSRMRKALRILFLFTIPLSWFTAMMTASRQVLLLQIPFIAGLLFIRYIKNASTNNKVAFVIVAVSLFVLSTPSVMEKYGDSTLAQRMQLDLKEDSRVELVKDAIRVGVEHFPLGVGPDNYIVYSYNQHFSHNVYAELFANEGVVGLILYLSLMISFLRNQLRRYKRYRDYTFLIFALFGLFYILDGIFYSFFQHLWLIGFFMLVATHSEVYYRDKYCFRNTLGR